MAVVVHGGWWPNTMQVMEPSSGTVWPHIQNIPTHQTVISPSYSL